MRLLGNTKSLLLTGLADVRSAVSEQSRRPGDRFGLILMIVSAACFALMAAVAKTLLPHTPMQAVVLSRGILMTATFVTLARRQGVPILGNNPRMLLVRGLLGTAPSPATSGRSSTSPWATRCFSSTATRSSSP